MFKIYFSIRSRNKQDENVTGISKSARVFRKRRNLVSMQFNLMNWLMETVSLILVTIGENIFLKILYVLLNSCGTPLVVLLNLLLFYLIPYNLYKFGQSFGLFPINLKKSPNLGFLIN